MGAAVAAVNDKAGGGRACVQLMTRILGMSVGAYDNKHFYSLKDGCGLLLSVRPRPPRIADRSTVSVFTPDSSQWASVHTYLRI